jgi:hypothetical protein
MPLFYFPTFLMTGSALVDAPAWTLAATLEGRPVCRSSELAGCRCTWPGAPYTAPSTPAAIAAFLVHAQLQQDAVQGIDGTVEEGTPAVAAHVTHA